MEPYQTKRENRRAMFGIFLVVLGGLLLLKALGLIPWQVSHVIFSWPMILIVIGLVQWLINKKRDVGIVLIAVGGVFLAPRIFDISFGELARYFWPLALIAIGLVLFLRRDKGSGTGINAGTSQTFADDSFIDEVNIFGGGKKIITSQKLRGGRFTTIFGGAEIDLLNADLNDGYAEFDIFTLFGGTTFIVPADWQVKLDDVTIFGGFSDSRAPMYVQDQENKVLRIKGYTIFGGGEIKSYSKVM